MKAYMYVGHLIVNYISLSLYCTSIGLDTVEYRQSLSKLFQNTKTKMVKAKEVMGEEDPGKKIIKKWKQILKILLFYI